MRDNATPSISVIIPTFNRATWLRQAMASALRQSCGDFELIVVDDASTDATRELVANVGDPRVRYLRHDRNRGAAVAKNTGIGAARGGFIAFLDDDDEWLPTKLEKQLAKFNTSPADVGVVYAGSSVVSERSGRTVHSFTVYAREFTEVDFLRTVPFTTSVPLLRKTCVLEAGLFDESLPGAQDRDLWIRLTRHCAFDFVPEILVRRYIHGEQITTNLKAKIAAKEIICRKYHDVLSRHPGLLADHLHRLGMLYCLDGRTARGLSCFWQAIRQAPTRRTLYKDLALTLATPRRHRQTLLATRIETVDGIRLYY
jgi:glycosyltransferase involved in cell wall biosynthesis